MSPLETSDPTHRNDITTSSINKVKNQRKSNLFLVTRWNTWVHAVDNCDDLVRDDSTSGSAHVPKMVSLPHVNDLAFLKLQTTNQG